ncbi:MAG: caspase family protein [Acidobacteriota bacterium]
MKKVSLAAVSVGLLFASLVFPQADRNLVRDKPAAKAASRTALVIGNGTYSDAPLKNPPNDATDIAAALRLMGFEVMAYTNLDQTGMKRAIREFGTKLRAKGGVGLFYYAGHGVQVKGTNYLIPVGATVNNEEEVEYEAVEAGLAMAQMEAAKNQMNIVILDACRNNPFARSFRSADKGLASIDAPAGTMLAYSTAPGSVASDGVGRNGLYTQELLKAMRTTGLSIEDVFKRVRISVRSATTDKQTPWESSSLTGKFYFTGGDAATVAAPATSADTVAYEKEFWESMKNSTDARDFEEYLTNYPGGVFAPTARLKLRKLSENQAPPTGETTRSEGTSGGYSELFTKADEALQKNDSVTAIDLLKKAIAADPTKTGAYEKLANIYYEQVDPVNAPPAMIAALKNGGTLLLQDARYNADFGKLKLTKTTITFYAEKKTYEAEIADFDISMYNDWFVHLKMKPSVDKIVKGSKDDTRMYLSIFSQDEYMKHRKNSMRSFKAKGEIIKNVLIGLQQP